MVPATIMMKSVAIIVFHFSDRADFHQPLIARCSLVVQAYNIVHERAETLLRPAPFAAFPESQAACASRRLFLFQPDLKDTRPQFPGYENPFALRVVGDAVKHGLRVGFLIIR